jgi:hypothetical protein
MRKSAWTILSVVVLAGALLTGMAVSVSAAGPQLVNYQGILTDGGGTPITVATNVDFRIYDDPVAGNLLWSETQSVTPDANGLFNVILGSAGMPIPDSAFAGGAWFTMEIAPDPEMTPRQELTSVPFSFRTRTVDDASGGHIRGKVSIGNGTTNPGNSAFAAGRNNTATGHYSTVSGGDENTIDQTNTSPGTTYSVIGGGYSNYIDQAQRATISGGYDNTISAGPPPNSASSATISGGVGNAITSNGQSSVISGGNGNSINNSTAATIGGGSNGGITNGTQSVIIGGESNSISASQATVAGGSGNHAGGQYSFAAGRRAKANHLGTHVWADATNADFASTANNQFLVRANGGVGIGTNAPAAGAMAVDMTSVHFGDGSGYDFPMTDGSADQVLASDGTGQLDWASLPGVAGSAGADAGPGGTVTTSATNMDSVDVTFPADGFVVILCDAEFKNNTAGNYLWVDILRNGASVNGGWVGDWDPGDVDGFYDQHQSLTYTEAVAAGSYQYKFTCTADAGTADYYSDKITVMFFPASYGTVGSPAPRLSTGGADAARSPNSGSTGTIVGTDQRLQATASTDNAAILRELQALRDKVSQLEQRIGENK